MKPRLLSIVQTPVVYKGTPVLNSSLTSWLAYYIPCVNGLFKHLHQLRTCKCVHLPSARAQALTTCACIERSTEI
jgi:hypothetical protein